MTARKYGVTTTLSRGVFRDYGKSSRQEAEAVRRDRAIQRMRRDLGECLLEALEDDIKKPAVIRLKRREYELETDPSLLRIELIADVMPTEVMTVRITDLQSAEWSYPPYPRGSERLPIEWQCAYCGQVNSVIEHLDCRKCGAPRIPMR